jgi:two-component system cell cycle response regulator
MIENSVVLIVEDDAFLSRALVDKFQHEGFIVHSAMNGEEGLSIMKKEKIDVVLLDLMMPMKNGFEVLEEIQKDPALSKIPVMVLSNLGQDNDIEKAMKLGACDFLVKSNVPLKDVVTKVHTCLALKDEK